MSAALFGDEANSEESQWLSVSDMMAGLMVVFMFILIAYIRPIIESRERVREIAVAWNESETQIYEALQSEFSVDLARWDAELDAQSLTLRFKAPDVLFNQASADIRPEFAIILDDFFPRYISILSQFSKSIEEIRIEGHTSSEWNVGASSSDAYFGNMALSQMRTRSVLAYALSTLKDSQLAEWAKAHATANGLSSSRLIRLTDGTEDRDRSRRVEFRVVTDTKRQIVRILESLEG